MKQKKWIFFALLLIAASTLVLMLGKKTIPSEISTVSGTPQTSTVDPQMNVTTHLEKSQSPPEAGTKSIVEMSKILRKFTLPENKLKDLVQWLENTNQDPIVSHDTNEDTGEMAIVRTRKPPPGTRYFHAQYFSDGAKDGGFVQHMSFEVRPGPTAMNDVVAAMGAAFGLQKPTVERDGYKKWTLPPGYIVWIKKMDAEDLSGDPFNAYSAADIGTIRIAIESDIHSEDE